jgi:hypothetical protein
LFRLQRNGRFPRRFCILIKPAFCIGVSRRSSAGLLFCFRSIPYIWAFGAVCSFSHHHGSGDLSFITIKSPNGSRVKRVHQKKRISTYRTTFRRKGWGCLFYDIGVLDLLGGYMGEYLGVGAGWQDIVRVLLLGNLRELVFPNRFWGGQGWLRSWLNFPFFFLLSNLPFGFTVPWVDGGLAAAWFHFYILIFCFLLS